MIQAKCYRCDKQGPADNYKKTKRGYLEWECPSCKSDDVEILNSEFANVAFFDDDDFGSHGGT